MGYKADNDGWLINRAEERSSASSERAVFIQRTYLHLAFAILALVGLEYVLLRMIDPEPILRVLFGRGSMGIFVVLLAFMGVSYLAQSWARSDTSRAVQYMGLGLYVVAEAVILLPILFVADRFYPNVIWQAAIMTLAVFAGLSLAALTTRKDFSFLGPIISIGSMLALGVIIASLIFGFSLGLFFSFAMVALLAACILWETSQLMYHYNTTDRKSVV